MGNRTEVLLMFTEEEIKLLLRLLPEDEEVEPNHFPMFYMTGSYEADLQLMEQVNSIREKLTNALS
jgi:hypothetical protein